MTIVMDRMPNAPLTARKSRRGRLLSVLAGWFGRGTARPTRLEPDHLSRYLLKDIGLSADRVSRHDPRSSRGPMDWPMR